MNIEKCLETMAAECQAFIKDTLNTFPIPWRRWGRHPNDGYGCRAQVEWFQSNKSPSLWDRPLPVSSSPVASPRVELQPTQISLLGFTVPDGKSSRQHEKRAPTSNAVVDTKG